MVLSCESARPSSPAAIDLQERLRESPYWPVRQLVCVTSEEYVIVRGTLPSYYLKQVAQSLATRVVGSGRIRSDIQVTCE
jgi:hypothetical protein